MLSNRLASCAKCVPRGSIVCDVGTDHALLPAYLVCTGICPRAIATDIRPGPLEAAQRTLRKYGVLDKVTLIECDGLTKVESDGLTHVIIAGLGGETITNILSACAWAPQKKWILQPMTRASVLRQWLAGQGYTWQEQIAVEGERYYTILNITERGDPWVLSAIEREAGLLDWDVQASRQYGQWKARQWSDIAQQQSHAGHEEATNYADLSAQLRELLA